MFFYLISYFLIMGLPVIGLICGAILLLKGHRIAGIFVCLASVLLLLFMRDNIEFYGYVVYAILPVTLFIGSFLLLNVYTKNKSLKNAEAQKEASPENAEAQKEEKRYRPIPLIIIGILLISIYPGMMISAHISENQYYKDAPVSRAVLEGNISKLETLLQNGADPNEVFNGTPAIFYACWRSLRPNSNDDAVKLLLSYNADIHARDEWNDSLMRSVLRIDISPFQQHDKYDLIHLLLNSGYDVHETNEYGFTLLMRTAAHYHWPEEDYDLPLEIAKLFVDYGVDINAADHNGRTALMYVCAHVLGLYGSVDGDDLIIAMDMEDDFSRLWLKKFNIDLIKYLITNGADIYLEDNNGYTALDHFSYAMEKNIESKDDEYWGEDNTKIIQSPEYIEIIRAIEELLTLPEEL